jgi:hypothetical protein
VTPTITTPCRICSLPIEAVVSEVGGLLQIDIADPMAAHMSAVHPQEVP